MPKPAPAKLKVVNGPDEDSESAIPFHDGNDADVLRNF